MLLKVLPSLPPGKKTAHQEKSNFVQQQTIVSKVAGGKRPSGG